MVSRPLQERGGTSWLSRALLDLEGYPPSTRDMGEEIELPSPIDFQLVHATRNGLELAAKLGEGEFFIVENAH